MASFGNNSVKRKRQSDFADSKSQSLDAHGFPLLPIRKTHSELLDRHEDAVNDRQVGILLVVCFWTYQLQTCITYSNIVANRSEISPLPNFYTINTAIAQNKEGILPVATRLLLYMFLADLGQAATSRQRWQFCHRLYQHQWIESISKSHTASTNIKYIATGWNSYCRACQELVLQSTSINRKQILTKISIALCVNKITKKMYTPASKQSIGSH